MITFAKKTWYRITGKTPADMPMVRYWRTKDSVAAKVTTDENGSLVMFMEGEDYPFPGFPHGHLLYGPLSKLKHEIKNQIFNDSWARLENGASGVEVAYLAKKSLDGIFEVADRMKYEMPPPERMNGAVKEIYRAWTVVAPGEKSLKLRDVFTFILQEDDSYRFRIQWMAQFFNPNRWWMRLLGKDPIEQFKRALTLVEYAEVIDDMKERIRLLRRVLLAFMEDKDIREKFLAFCREIDWNKVIITEREKYFFRGKYFKCDTDLFSY